MIGFFLGTLFASPLWWICVIGIVALIVFYWTTPHPTPSNPFSLSNVRKVGDLVTDHKIRHKVLKQRFKQELIPSDLDAIVIGSGLGGLSVASILSRAGQRVLVLEQHDVAGGNFHVFTEKGFEFDTGVHCMGKLKKGSHAWLLLDQITGGAIQYLPMNEAFAKVTFGFNESHSAYEIYSGLERFSSYLKDRFPDEHSAIDGFIKHLKSTRKAMMGYAVLKLIPKWLAKLLLVSGLFDYAFKIYKKMSPLTISDVLCKLTTNDQLKAILSYPALGYLGTLPSQSSAMMTLEALAGYVYEGAYFLRGGPSEIPFQTIPVIESRGGRVLVEAKVSRILLSESNQAVGVAVLAGDKELQIFANNIISDAGLDVTFNKLLPREIAEKSAIYHQLQHLGVSVAYMSVFIGLEGSSEELGLKAQDLWAFSSHSIEEDMARWLALSVEEASEEEIPMVFASFSSAKDTSWSSRIPGKSNCLLTIFAKYEWFAPWKNEKVKRRGKDYEVLKDLIARKAWNQILQIEPQLSEKVVYFEASSTITPSYYRGIQNGEIYGLSHRKERFLPEAAMTIRPQTDIDCLYLTGQDVFCLGTTGAMFGGLFCAGAILHRNLDNDLKELSRSFKATEKQTKVEDVGSGHNLNNNNDEVKLKND